MGIELQNPFSPCQVTWNPNFTLRNVELAQTDNLPPLSYHKPHAACSKDHMLPSFSFSHLNIYSHLSCWTRWTITQNPLMWEQSNLQPWQRWGDGDLISAPQRLSHSSPHCPYFLSAGKIKWSIHIVFHHSLMCVLVSLLTMSNLSWISVVHKVGGLRNWEVTLGSNFVASYEFLPR